jgi:two-component system response regulator VicR
MKRILYADGEIDTADAVRFLLTKDGFTVDIADSGNLCLKLAKSTSYDLILADLVLPDMTAYQAFSRLKSFCDSKFAIVSNIPLSSDVVQQLKNQGISEYINKPFSKDELVSHVKSIISNRAD